jgi:hypothetical protein
LAARVDSFGGKELKGSDLFTFSEDIKHNLDLAIDFELPTDLLNKDWRPWMPNHLLILSNPIRKT